MKNEIKEWLVIADEEVKMFYKLAKEVKRKINQKLNTVTKEENLTLGI
ncbi:MAG: hypothetical protein LBI80_05635 [Endomicrobium sp.]|jgi:hypothetical protein|nr:hypothetical protein [Endomicrobium sp.]